MHKVIVNTDVSMNKCVKRIELILKSSLYNETPDEMYYIPEKMERHG